MANLDLETALFGFLFVGFFLLYWWLLPRLVGCILESPRLSSAQWILVGLGNVLVLAGVWAVASNILYCYYAMMVLMLAELTLFHRDRFSGALLCTLACCIHVAAVPMMSISILAMSTGQAPYLILSSERTFFLALLLAFCLLDLCIITAIRLVPLVQVRVINQHREQQWFMIVWMTVSTLFLVYMANLLSDPQYPAELCGGQIAASIASLIGLYIVLFFSFQTSSMLGYKEKNAELQQVIYQEQQYRNSMVRDALATYEVNVTQDVMIKGFDELSDEVAGSVDYRYTDMLILMAQKLIYSEDIPDYVRCYGRINVLRLFAKGEREIVIDYRRVQDDTYIWVRSVANLVQDAETGDIKAFLCIKNIDAEKKQQLELQRKAERDLLTGLYNRSTTGKLIDEYLAFHRGHSGSALFMIDVDNFKEINDHLGHVYGDAVLCELADKLVRIFRSNDIVGRIGGDEFIVFLKDCATPDAAVSKAEQICKAFHVTYQGTEKDKYTISGSVGITFSPTDGVNFDELYGNADVALYAAKSKGKNGHAIYDGSSFAGYTSQRSEIQPLGNISQKGFRENRIEYVFKMLYQSENPVAAIHSVLELVASHFAFERGYIFETSKDGKTTSNTFEWCIEGVTPEINNLQHLPIEVVATAHAHFQQSGTFILRNLNELRPIERAVLEPQGIKSMFQFGIFDKTRLLGFVGFDNCKSESVLSDTEIDEMKTICNILATFFVKQYIDEVAEKDLLARQEVMNHLGNYIYVINVETFELLFMNEKVQRLLEGAEGNCACYRFFRGNDKQCDDCPIRQLLQTGADRAVAEVFNDHLGIWMESTASLMRWTDGSLACLLNCSDITKQKQEHLNHVRELETLVYVDALTGCRTYYKFKEDAYAILERERDVPHLLVKTDIDNFKLVNQIYGNQTGDEILCKVAQAMTQTMRSENEIFARVANDEFIVLLSMKDDSDIETQYKQFLKNFTALVDEEISFKCRFPRGCYIVPPDNGQALDINDMFEKVNTAHKQAKADKALKFIFYDESMTQRAMHIKEIENRMSDALLGGEFIIYLQPKYYLKDETIGGAEALVRWNNENPDLFAPNAFVPIFEQNGFIVKLDFYVFRNVCRLLRSWLDAGLTPVTVSVNFSRLHLDNPRFVPTLCKIADDAGVDRKYLEIEITETVIYDNIEKLEVLLDEMQASGFSMSMDDFGSGYSSLGMLKSLPVDVIKIDRSFFVNQRDGKRSKTVIGSVIRMAAELGIRTVAEGVENQEHIDFLRELQCDMVQGYYYAKPMPVEQFTALLEAPRA